MLFFPSILLAAFQQQERRRRRCRERGEICGFSGDKLPHLGKTRASPVRHGGRTAERGPAAPGSAAHGAPGLG